MKVFIAADHNGYELKKYLLDYLNSKGYELVDCGDQKLDNSDDFPKFAIKAVSELLDSKDKNNLAILICGSGQGMCMAANRFKGIRASLCTSTNLAYDARNDDDSNVLCLSAKEIAKETNISIVNVFLTTQFAKAPRFIRRINELDEIG